MLRLAAFIAVLFLSLAQSEVQAQQQLPEFTQLQMGTPIERTIASGQAHLYTVKLEEGQFVQVVVQQHGIDVIIAVAGPDTKKIGDFDSPNGTEGPENISVVAETTGEYVLGLRPLNQGDAVKPGKYEIRILELRKATEQELSTINNKAAARAKALTLVKDASLLIPQVRSLVTRVHAQMQSAALLWETDEKTARKLMNDAVLGLKEYIAGINYADDDAMENLQPANVLRYELIQALGDRDPEAALALLRATRPSAATSEMTAGWGMGDREEQLELTLANQVARRDPKRAYEIAQENLKTRLSSNLFHTVSQLLQSDPLLARKLAKDIQVKLLDEKWSKNPELPQLAFNLIRSRLFAQVRFDNDVNGQGSQEPQNHPLLSEQDRRDLLQKTLNEALTAGSSESRNEQGVTLNLLQSLKEFGPELEAQFPGSLESIEKRLGELQKQVDPAFKTIEKLQTAINNSSPEIAMESISQSPPEMRLPMYQQLADRTAAIGDISRARQIIDEKLTNPWQRRQALNNLDRLAVHQLISKGKTEEALRILATLRPVRSRAQIISNVVSQIGPGRKRAVALALLEQVRSLLGNSTQADDQEEMNALIELAMAFARYDTKRSFEILDPLVDQFNEINDAARKLSGFSYQSHKDGEVNMYNGNIVLTLVNQISKALGILASSNFDKAKAAADRLQAPEVRLVVYLNIAQEVIQPNQR